MTPFDTRFARAVTVTDGNGTQRAMAFIQPLSVTSPESPAPTPAGVADARRWLLLMEPAALEGPAEIADGERRYSLLRWEEIGGHIEGVLCLKGGGPDA